jgi:hypothetical protein
MDEELGFYRRVSKALTQRGLTGRLSGGKQGTGVVLIGEALPKPTPEPTSQKENLTWS